MRRALGIPDLGPGAVLPPVDLDTWRENLFQLTWQQHGGSGLNASVADVLGMYVADRDWLLERIEERRSEEAEALRKK